jgi:hypothetical protein
MNVTQKRQMDRRLVGLILLAVVMAAGHHIDHLIRGNAVGWPVTPEVNAFTASLVIYPLIVGGLLLYRIGVVGPGFWTFLSSGGAIFLTAIHFGPFAVEPPAAILDHYDSPVVGWMALLWLIGLVGVLVASSVYEVRLWRGGHSGSAS